MCKVRCEVVMNGPGPNEQIVKIREASGFYEEVVATIGAVTNGFLETSHILGRDAEKVLVELPRESASGKWRLWVSERDIEAHA